MVGEEELKCESSKSKVWRSTWETGSGANWSFLDSDFLGLVILHKVIRFLVSIVVLSAGFRENVATFHPIKKIGISEQKTSISGANLFSKKMVPDGKKIL